MKREMPAVMRQMVVRGLRGKRHKCGTEIRKFALTLHFYSPRAYNYVLRKVGKNILPAASTLRKWACTEHFDPGFNTEILTYLKNPSDKMEGNKQMLCNIVLDEMSNRD